MKKPKDKIVQLSVANMSSFFTLHALTQEGRIFGMMVDDGTSTVSGKWIELNLPPL